MRQAIGESHPHLLRFGEVPENGWNPLPAADMPEGNFGRAIEDFYLTNPIARSSSLMAELSAIAGAEGKACCMPPNSAGIPFVKVCVRKGGAGGFRPCRFRLSGEGTA